MVGRIATSKRWAIDRFAEDLMTASALANGAGAELEAAGTLLLI
jgi:hypothetical protein